MPWSCQARAPSSCDRHETASAAAVKLHLSATVDRQISFDRDVSSVFVAARPSSLFYSFSYCIMSLDPPTYLSSLQNSIRARPIPWEGAVRAGHITEGELKKIKSVDKVRWEQRRQTVSGDLDGFRTLLLGGDEAQSVLVSAGKRGDVVQYILVLAGDMIDGEASSPLTWESERSD